METGFESTDTPGNNAVAEDAIVPAKRQKTVLEAFRDTNVGKPLQVCCTLTFINCLHRDNEAFICSLLFTVFVSVMVKLINLY